MVAYVCLPQEWSKGLQILQSVNRFILGLNVAKNTRYIKKNFNKSCSELSFVQKSSWAHMFISPTSGDRGLQRSINMFEIL